MRVRACGGKNIYLYIICVYICVCVCVCVLSGAWRGWSRAAPVGIFLYLFMLGCLLFYCAPSKKREKRKKERTYHTPPSHHPYLDALARQQMLQGLGRHLLQRHPLRRLPVPFLLPKPRHAPPHPPVPPQAAGGDEVGGEARDGVGLVGLCYFLLGGREERGVRRDGCTYHNYIN